MRWFVMASLGLVAALGVGALSELRVARPAPAASARVLPTRFAPPRDVRGEAAVLRLAFSAGLPNAHVFASELAQDAQFANPWREESALGMHAARETRVALPEPSFIALTASAALLAAISRARSRRPRVRRPVASSRPLPH